jgi:hypothetical protein
MYTINFHVKQKDDTYWTYMQKSPGNIEKGEPLHRVLAWIIEQLSFEMFQTEIDEDGEICTLIIGEGAAPKFASMEEAEKHAQETLLRVNIAEVLAKAREEGTQQEHVNLVERTTVTRTGWAELRTEFHYARELVKMLERLRDVTFNFSAPGIHGRAPEEVVFYLREATRCFLYGLLEASVALCRACLEEALKSKLLANGQGIAALMKEPKKTDRGAARGELDRLIRAAAGIKILDGPHTLSADRIRSHGNLLMHDRPQLTEAEAKQDLDDLRGVVDFLFAS